MTIKFCLAEGCPEVAIGVSRHDPGQRPESRYCRAHYLAQARTVRCEVVGVCEITDARTDAGVGRGLVVELDPLQTNIAQLVHAGHVKLLPAKQATKNTGAGAESKKDG